MAVNWNSSRSTQLSTCAGVNWMAVCFGFCGFIAEVWYCGWCSWDHLLAGGHGFTNLSYKSIKTAPLCHMVLRFLSPPVHVDGGLIILYHFLPICLFVLLSVWLGLLRVHYTPLQRYMGYLCTRKAQYAPRCTRETMFFGWSLPVRGFCLFVCNQ